MKIQNKRRRKS